MCAMSDLYRAEKDSREASIKQADLVNLKN